jgi:hypothetical protein
MADNDMVTVKMPRIAAHELLTLMLTRATLGGQVLTTITASENAELAKGLQDALQPPHDPA